MFTLNRPVLTILILGRYIQQEKPESIGQLLCSENSRIVIAANDQ